jgi:uncharacterized protein
MSAALPTQLDPWQAVARKAAFAGSLALADLPRLREELVGESHGAAARADFEIAFRRDEAGRPVVLGRVQAVLHLACQRCLGVVEHRVDAPIRLLLVQGPDLAQDPPEPYEALPVVDGRVTVAELIEDELLLALPQIPIHGVGLCHTALQDQSPRTASTELAQDRSNPFAVLGGWKTESQHRT